MILDMFRWLTRRPEDAIQTTIEAAVAADRADNFQEAVELYAAGIEKMIAQLARTLKRGMCATITLSLGISVD